MGSSRLFLRLYKKKSTTRFRAVLFLLVENTGIEPENEVTAVRIDFVAQYGYNIIRILLL